MKEVFLSASFSYRSFRFIVGFHNDTLPFCHLPTGALMLWPRKFSLCLSTFTSFQLNSAHQESVYIYIYIMNEWAKSLTLENRLQDSGNTLTGWLVTDIVDLIYCRSERTNIENITETSNTTTQKLTSPKILTTRHSTPFTTVDEHNYINYRQSKNSSKS